MLGNLLSSLNPFSSGTRTNQGYIIEKLKNERFGFGDWGNVFGDNNYVELSHKIAPLDSSISIISDILSSADVYAKDTDGNVLDNDPLAELINNPNQNQGKEEFLKDFTRVLLSSGFCYLEPFSDTKSNIYRLDKLDSEDRPELRVLNSDLISFETSHLWGWYKKKLKEGYFRYCEFNQTEIKHYKDLIPFWDKQRNDKNPYMGISRIESIRYEVENYQLALKAKQNQIRLSGNIVMHPSTKSLSGFGGSLEDPVGDVGTNITQREVIEGNVLSNSLLNGKGLTILDTEVAVVNLMEGLQNVDFDSYTIADVRAIYNRYGIPRELQNLGDTAATYENRKQGLLELTTNVVQPIAANLSESISLAYPNYENKICFDFSKLPYFDLVEKRKQETKSNFQNNIIALYKDGFLTLDEAKQKLQEHEII